MDAQFNLAIAYENGQGVGRSLADALHYFELAARQGDLQVGVQRRLTYKHTRRTLALPQILSNAPTPQHPPLQAHCNLSRIQASLCSEASSPSVVGEKRAADAEDGLSKAEVEAVFEATGSQVGVDEDADIDTVNSDNADNDTMPYLPLPVMTASDTVGVGSATSSAAGVSARADAYEAAAASEPVGLHRRVEELRHERERIERVEEPEMPLPAHVISQVARSNIAGLGRGQSRGAWGIRARGRLQWMRIGGCK